MTNFTIRMKELLENDLMNATQIFCIRNKERKNNNECIERKDSLAFSSKSNKQVINLLSIFILSGKSYFNVHFRLLF